MPELELFLHDQYVGTVRPVSRDRSRVMLDIDRDYRQQTLLSESFTALPGRAAVSNAVSNFLGGYVPEGNHRERMAAKRHVSKDDLFALLTEFGGSIAGAVTLRTPADARPGRPSYESLSEEVLTQRLEQALRDSDQGIPDDSRSTLPGYQPKLLVARFDGQWAYPHGRAHSTHILKPQVPSRPHRIFDEYYSHQLARSVGLSRYDSWIGEAGAMTYLAIQRFDRDVDGDDVRLHHQEDLAQALNLDWRDTDVKFQDPSWPSATTRASARRIGQLLAEIPGGDAVVEEWIRQLTYHVAIGNNDAHAKNVALMHQPSGTVLAQLYDALPNFFQEGLVSWNMALAVDGEFDHRRMSVDRLRAEIADWAVIRDSRAESLISHTLASVAEAIGAVQPLQQVSSGLIEQLEWNVSRLRAGDEIGERPRG